ncbi:MAG: fumarylacetoacetase [Acidobacteriota bacterium]|nr:fumarylacetoacetase [Acidobacteriota bacterium]
MTDAYRSWLPDANDPANDFPLTHLPYAAFEVHGERHLCVAIGAHLLDLHAARELLPPSVAPACQSPTLNPLLSLGPRAWAQLRQALIELLHISVDPSRRQAAESALHSLCGATLANPVHVPNYTDFYASLHHATRVGKIFRPDGPLLPNYKHLPIAYHGRASSIISSGTPVVRPRGQTPPEIPLGNPAFHPSHALDYELELAFYLGQGNELGCPVPIAHAAEHLFGISLLNDWSARDLQSWEYQPLGPFLGKSFSTSVSPWITPMAALAPFRAPAISRADGDPHLLPYLHSAQDQSRGNLNVELEISLSTSLMRRNKLEPYPVCRTNSKVLYWTAAQMIAHHTSNGCNLQAGDLLATGTISGEAETSAGCLLELTRNGREPITLPTAESRSFLDDGDEVILRGWCEAAGHPRIGLGECRGIILPAIPD